VSPLKTKTDAGDEATGIGIDVFVSHGSHSAKRSPRSCARNDLTLYLSNGSRRRKIRMQ
jgi:hypothetical protein